MNSVESLLRRRVKQYPVRLGALNSSLAFSAAERFTAAVSLGMVRSGPPQQQASAGTAWRIYRLTGAMNNSHEARPRASQQPLAPAWLKLLRTPTAAWPAMLVRVYLPPLLVPPLAVV